MSDFDQKKTHILKEIGLNSQENPDASPKGTIDEQCLPLIKLINSHKDMVTTSSCSGRVSVFIEGSKKIEGSTNNFKIGAKGEGGHWLFVTHDKSELTNWWKNKITFNEIDSNIFDKLDGNTRYILFKYEPLILHVKCRNFEIASRLYSAAMGCGYRESGIGANNNVAIRISIRLDIPIGYLDVIRNNVISMVQEDYIKIITKLAYDRFMENEKKINVLHERISKEVIDFEKKKSKLETKEGRKERKMREGLARREGVRKLKDEQRKLKELQQQSKLE